MSDEPEDLNDDMPETAAALADAIEASGKSIYWFLESTAYGNWRWEKRATALILKALRLAAELEDKGDAS